MAKYTLEISQIIRSKGYNLFDFDYEFYTDDEEIKKNFEQKFIDRYMFHEIGFETIGRFKHYLKQSLNENADYYKQLYESEMKSKKIDFLLNKDYTETYLKDIVNSSNISAEQQSNYVDDSKSSNIADGVSDVSLSKGNLTSVGSNASNTNDTSNSNMENNKQENYTLTAKGNIGITSTAQLLKEWRSVMINLDQIILDDLQDLFMGIY